MKLKEISLSILFFFIFTVLFFNKTFSHGFIPFPGDLLISEYNPWKTEQVLGYVAGSYPNKGQYFDVLRQMYPWKTLGLELVKSHQLPLWNPYDFSGTPLFANFQSALFYPLNTIYSFVSQNTGWTILVMLQPLLAGLFTYFFARKIGLSKIASFFAGISWSFSSFFSVWLEYNTVLHVVIWLPVALLASEFLIEKISALWTAIFIFALSFSLFAGHPQVAAYLYLFVFLYVGHRINTSIQAKDKIKKLALFVLFFFIAIGIGSVQLFPGIELTQLAARAGHPYEFLMTKLLIQPFQLIMFFVPDFFGNPATRNYWITDTYVGKVTTIGIVPIMFILLTFSQWKNLLIRFFLGAAVVVLLLATNNPLTQLLYHIPIPLFSASSPTLAIFLFGFCMSILSGFGIDLFQKNTYSFKRLLQYAIPVLLVFIFLWIAVFLGKKGIFMEMTTAAIAFRNLFYTTAIVTLTLLLVLIANIKRKYILGILIVLILLQTFDLFKGFQKFNPFVPKEFMYPPTSVTTYIQSHAGIQRFWAFGNASIEANIPTQMKLFSPEGYDPLYPKWYGEFIQSSQDGNIHTTFTDRTRSDAVIAPASSEDFPTNQYRQKILNLLGVSYMLDRVENNGTEKTFSPDMYSLVFQEHGWNIYQNKKALPHIFLASKYSTYSSAEDFSRKFFAASFDPAETILLENPLAQPLSATNLVLKTIAYQPNSIILATKTDGNALLFLADTYYPGWKAFIDGKETTIVKANYAFRAVLVPSGTHKILFSYQPRSFYLGLKMTILSIGILLTLLVIIKKQNHEK